MDKLKVFEEELDYIKRKDIRAFTEEAIKLLPDYFFLIPASSTGKYHPTYSLNEGGLVRHSKALVRIAVESFKCTTLFPFTSDEKDIIISACILHDGGKSGIPQQKYTVFEHPLIITKLIRNDAKTMSCIDKDISCKILSCIERHMGIWNKNNRSNIILPLPQTPLEKFVHYMDYLASRKCLEMNFDVYVTREDM